MTDERSHLHGCAQTTWRGAPELTCLPTDKKPSDTIFERLKNEGGRRPWDAE